MSVYKPVIKLENKWDRIGKIDGEEASDQSGISVSLSSDGTIVAIGVPYKRNIDFKGSVIIYRYKSDNKWDKIGKIDGEASLTNQDILFL